MKFSDIIFTSHPHGGVMSRTFFPNGYELSVVASAFAYSTPRTDFDFADDYEAFEVAVFNQDGEFVTSQFGFVDDVQGWLTRQEIEELMKSISEHD
jgi:hypothetical protein